MSSKFEPLVSIYVPVYNSEKYLDQCIQSIINQTYTNIELYIFDDESSDESYNICEKYANIDTRIVLQKGKHGESIDAMNKFLKTAKGEYIAFVDNDDYIEYDLIEKMIGLITQSHTDCVIIPYICVDNYGKIMSWNVPILEDNRILTTKEIIVEFLTTIKIEGFRWNKIYKKAIIDNVRFENVFPADIPTEFELLTMCHDAIYLNYPGYYYRQHVSSSVATVDSCKVNGFLNAFKNIGIKAQKLGFIEAGEYYLTWRYIHSMFGDVKNRKSFSQEQWSEIMSVNSWDKYLNKNLFQVINILNWYRCGESKLKMFIKALVVYYYAKIR